MTEKQKILVVDDDPDMREGLSVLLSQEGFDVKCAVDGNGAIESSQGEVPNLIILDVMLPDIDGFRVCEKLKQDPLTRNIPVVFLTVRDQLKHKIRGYIVGGNRYIVKPFDKEELLKTIKIVFRQKELGDVGGEEYPMDPRD